MKYMLLIYGDATKWQDIDEETQGQMMKEYFSFTQSIADSGELVAGDPLQGIDTATTVRFDGGERVLTDGPFAETKEVLGGYYLVDVADLDRALELAAQLPGAHRGFDSIEVRPLAELPRT